MHFIKLKLFYFIFLTMGFPFLSKAQWVFDAAINTPVCQEIKTQQGLHGISDGNGGIILTWEDNRDTTANNGDIYVQRIDKNGIPKWTIGGIAICSNNSIQKSVSIVEGGNGSAILAWDDLRNGNDDIYVQKIDSNGTALWNATGVQLTNKTTAQKNPKLIGDNAGGAIVVWEDSLSFYFDIYAQRVNSNGAVQWATNGIGICTAQNNQINPRIDSDSNGGGIITWQDKRNSNDYDIYSQRINSTGNTLWTANGVAVCNSVNTQSNPKIEPDGSGGALISWADKRNAIDYDIYCQRLNASGTALWNANGIVVCNAVGNQSAIDMKFLGSNEVLLSWKDLRTANFQIFAQVLDLSGTIFQATNGIQLSNSQKAINSNAIAIGGGEAIVVWQDSSALGWDIKAQKLNSNGDVQWTNGGVLVSFASNDQVNPCNVADGDGGAIFAWEDKRNSNFDIYAQRIFFDGTTKLNEKNLDVYDGSLSFPNPCSSNNLTIKSFKNCNSTVQVFDELGKLLIEEKTNSNGNCLINTIGLKEGFYFYKINSQNVAENEIGKFIISKK